MPDLETTQLGLPEADANAPLVQAPSEQLEPQALPDGLSPSASADLGLPVEETPQNDLGASQDDLGEEYKPYSQFPWENMEPELRTDVLEKLKKFHGDMSRGANEAADIKRDAAQYQQKAEWFDSITTQKWFQDAYISQQNGGVQAPAGQAQPAQAPTLNKLSEYGLDNEAGDAIERTIQERVGSALQPLSQQLEFIQRKLTNDSTERDLAEVRDIAKLKGLPSPDEKMTRMAQIIQSGEARTVKDAWRLAIFDELPDIVSKNARKAAQDELRHKAETTLPPKQGPTTEPGGEIFVGPNAVSEALHAAMTEQVQAAAKLR